MAESETISLDIPSLRDSFLSSAQEVQTQFSSTPASELAAHESSLLEISGSDMGVAMLDTLRRNGIETLELDKTALDSPTETVIEIMQEGQNALREQGFPDPNVNLYREAAVTAEAEGRDYFDVVSDLHQQEPIAIRQDLPEHEGFEVTADDTVEVAHEHDHAEIGGVELESEMSPMEDARLDAIVAAQIDGTNFCDAPDLQRFQAFLDVQPVTRNMHDDFIVERIADSWDNLPEAVRNYEPTATNVFGFQTPYPGMVDDIGAHENNQRFFGGHHITTETGYAGVDVHFDAADSLRGPVQNLHHGYEVGLLKSGIIDSQHYPELGAPLSDEGLAPNWERYEEHCAGLE